MCPLIKNPDADIATDVRDEVKHLVDEMGQVIVHCTYVSPTGGDGIRIWPSTYLFDHHSDHVSTLVHAEKITLYPVWTLTKRGDNQFTLIFTGLPKSCTLFDLIEDCNGAPGSFRQMNMRRNRDDIYFVSI